MDEKRPRLPALTGLRFFAALWVVMLHYAGSRPGALPSFPLLSRGWLGVNMFFVLSGFILAYTGLNGATLRRTHRAFWWARFSRIYPAYLLALAVAFTPLVHEWRYLAHPWAVMLSTPLLLQSWMPFDTRYWNPPGWSLSVEALFYLGFPFLAPAVARLSRPRLLILIAPLWLIALTLPALYSAAVASPIVLYVNPLLRLPEFLIGICAGCVFARDQRRLPRWAAPVSLGALLGIVAVAALAPASVDDALTHGALDPLFALLFYVLAWQAGPVARCFSLPAVVVLGEASYSLYLLHVPLWDCLTLAAAKPAIAPAGPAQSPVLMGAVVLAVAASLLCHQFVEIPARRALMQRAS